MSYFEEKVVLREKEMVERGCFGEYYPAKILHSTCSHCQHKKDPHPPPPALLLDESQVEKYKIGCVFYFYAKVVPLQDTGSTCSHCHCQHENHPHHSPPPALLFEESQVECKSQFCLPPAITGGCCQLPARQLQICTPTILISGRAPPRLQKNTRNAASFQFGLPCWSFPRCQQGCFWARGSPVLVERRCVRAAGVWVEFWGK